LRVTAWIRCRCLHRKTEAIVVYTVRQTVRRLMAFVPMLSEVGIDVLPAITVTGEPM
jgi:hypothetical protein